MTYWTTPPRALDAAGQPDGRYAVQVTGGKVTGWTALPATTIGSVVAGTRIAVDNTDPDNPVVSLASEQYVLTTVINGVPDFVWDETELVYTEVSL